MRVTTSQTPEERKRHEGSVRRAEKTSQPGQHGTEPRHAPSSFGRFRDRGHRFGHKKLAQHEDSGNPSGIMQANW